MMKSISSLFVLLALAKAACADEIGNVGAVNQSALGTPPQSRSRALAVGMSVQNKERIETGIDGSAQIIFRDTSTMTIGRKSSIVVDRFAYDVANSQISQGINLTKGILRFVGGGVSHTTGAEIKIPAASIGIRGGSILVMIETGGQAVVILQYGTATIVSSRTTRVLSRPGLAAIIDRDGGISEAFRAPANLITKAATKLSSTIGQNGGMSISPMDSDVREALSGLPNLNMTQGNGLNQIGHMWAGNALVQSFANAVNQYSTTTQVDALSQATAVSSDPTPGPGPGPVPPPVPPTPPTPPTPPAPGPAPIAPTAPVTSGFFNNF